MSKEAQYDASIPVLTEVFQDKPDMAHQPGQAAVPAVQDQIEQRLLEDWTESEWNALERRLSERILQQLQDRVDFVLEQRLRDSMEEVLQQALAGLTAELRQGIQQTIEKIVVRAVAQELAHLKTL
jgi:hypothetical protein